MSVWILKVVAGSVLPRVEETLQGYGAQAHRTGSLSVGRRRLNHDMDGALQPSEAYYPDPTFVVWDQNLPKELGSGLFVYNDTNMDESTFVRDFYVIQSCINADDSTISQDLAGAELLYAAQPARITPQHAALHLDKHLDILSIDSCT